jgi:hypothetical protein
MAEPNKSEAEKWAPIIAEELKKVPDADYWHACFAAAVDEGLDTEDAIKVATESSKDGPPADDDDE